jgi:hypothetical protein
MTRQLRCAILAAVVAGVMGQQARATILDGVQPAALDQPQINVIVYLPNQSVPQIGVTQDPLGGLLGGDSTVYMFNVPAYLDTGASGILFSTSTASLLNLTTETVGGVDVIYSDVGVAGTDDFHVSTPLNLKLAPFIPAQDMDQFADVNHTQPIITPYTTAVPSAAGTNLRVQVGIPPFATGGGDDIDQLIDMLSGGGSSLDVVGMPAIKGHVMVMDTAGVQGLGNLFDILSGGGDLFDLTDADLAALDSAGIKTYLYTRNTAPAFDANRVNNPGIPVPERRVKVSYASFGRFTEMHLNGSTVNDPTLPAPALEHNPFIGKNPVAVLDGQPGGDAPGITVTRTTGVTELATTGNWLLDTGAAASILSEKLALSLHVKYDPAHLPGPPPDPLDPTGGTQPLLVDSVTGVALPDQFTLVLGGVGGQQTLAGFWLDSLLLPTMEATELNNPDLNITFTHVPVLVGDITVKDPNYPTDPTKWLTLDGIFGMNMLIESINMPTDLLSLDFGAPSPSFFQWITFDEPNGELGLVFDPTTVPDAAVLINLAQPFFTASDVAAGNVSPNFAGGTLRVDVNTAFGQNFAIAAAGGTLDTFGHTVTFSGGSITGIGGLTITDSLHTVNGSGGGTLVLGDVSAYVGDTTIASGAIAELAAGGALPATNLTLNGSLLLNGNGQSVASLAGTDATAVLDTGSGGGLTINGSAATVFAGSIISTGSTPGASPAASPAATPVAALALKGSANLTLTGISSYAGATTLDSGTTLTLDNGGKITQTASVTNGGNLRLKNLAALTATGAVTNTGSVVVGSGATLTAGHYVQSGAASTLLDDGAISAPTVDIAGGVFGGHGTVNGQVTLNNSSLQVGASPDALHIAGNFTQTGGSIDFEIDPDGHGGFVYSTLVLDPGSSVSIGNATVAFHFKNGADPRAFFDSGAFTLDTFLNSSNGQAFSSVFNVAAIFLNDTFTASSTDFTITQFDFSPQTGATALLAQAVPEPATLALLAAPALLLLTRRGRNGKR